MAFLRQCLQELRARQPGEQDLVGLLLLNEIVSLPARVMPHLPAPPGVSLRGMDITVVPVRGASASIRLRRPILHTDPPRANPKQA
jgi:hypothetical protein